MTDTRTTDKARSERDEAVAFIRIVGEELVLHGHPGGDREVILANVRRLLNQKKEGTHVSDDSWFWLPVWGAAIIGLLLGVALTFAFGVCA